jgi:phosphatidylinositol alpha-1,6-mannosyltransferase
VTVAPVLILTQTYPPEPGGMQALMGGLAGALAASGHGVTVLADRNRTNLPEASLPGVALRRFGGPRPWRRWTKFLAARAALPGGVICDSWKSVGALPAFAGPVLVLAHGMEFPPDASPAKAARIAAALGRARWVVASSTYTAGLAARHVDRARIRVVNPPIAPQPAPRAADLAAAAALAPGPGPHLLSLSRLEPRKGIDRVIAALPALLPAHPGIGLVVAGDGPDRPRLVALAAALGVAARVRFAGRVTEGMKAALFQTATLFAMPTRREGASVEGFGIVYLEAAWHGLPALAGAEGGAADAVRVGETGLLVDAADPGAVAAGLASLLSDLPRLRAMGAAAAARVRRDFLWTAALPRYLALLAGDSAATATTSRS